MGCIEILYGTDGIGGVAKINSNMGCIEILLCEPYYDANGMINSNMGCIEIMKCHYPSAILSDKQ